MLVLLGGRLVRPVRGRDPHAPPRTSMMARRASKHKHHNKRQIGRVRNAGGLTRTSSPLEVSF